MAVEAEEDAGGELFAGGAIEHAFDEGELAAFVEPGEDGAVNNGLAEFFDEVEDKGGFAGAVDMEEAGEGFEAGVHDGAPDVRGEDAVAVIEGGVDGIGGALVGAAGEIEIVGEHVLDFLPIQAGGGAFEAHEFVADLVGAVARDAEGGAAEFAEDFGGVFERGAAVSFAALGEVAHEFFPGKVVFSGDDQRQE